MGPTRPAGASGPGGVPAGSVRVTRAKAPAGPDGRERTTAATTHLFAHLAPDVGQPLLAVKALRLQPAVAQHLYYLCVFLAILLEDQLALVVVVLVLAATTILAALSLILRNP